MPAWQTDLVSPRARHQAEHEREIGVGVGRAVPGLVHFHPVVNLIVVLDPELTLFGEKVTWSSPLFWPTEICQLGPLSLVTVAVVAIDLMVMFWLVWLSASIDPLSE